MLATFGKLECYRGDQLLRQILVTANGVAQNITGWTIRFTAKAKDTDADADAVIAAEATIVSAAGGEALLLLSSTDTDIEPGTYAADLEFTPSGSGPNTAKGSIQIVQDVRRGA